MLFTHCNYKCSILRLQIILYQIRFLPLIELSDKKLDKLKTTIPVIIGDRIKRFRKDKRLAQNQLAQMVGKDRQYLYKI